MNKSISFAIKSKLAISIAIVLLTLLSSIGLILTTATLSTAAVTDTTDTISAQLRFSGLDYPTAVAFDSAGNMYISNFKGSPSGSIMVIAKTSGTIFGQYVQANTATTLSAASGLDYPDAIAFDSSGNMYISNGKSSTSGSITVIAKTSGTIFGQYVQANTATTLSAASGLDYPDAIAFDSSGNMYISNEDSHPSSGTGSITVIAKNSGTIFGQSFKANTATTLSAASGLDYPDAIAFDSAGNMYISNYVGTPSGGTGYVTVIAKNSGTIFGQSFKANTATTLNAATGLNYATVMTFDSAGNMYIVSDEGASLSNTGFITVIAKNSGTIFGQSFKANTATTLSAVTGLDDPVGIAFDASGNMYIANYEGPTSSGTGYVTVVAKNSGTIFGQSFKANTATTLSASSGLYYPWNIAFDAAGSLYIANEDDNSIYVVGDHTLTLTQSNLSAATVNTPYSATFSASGGIFDYNWHLSSGTLPNGLSLNSQTGEITGIPTTTGTSSFSVTVTDLAGEHQTENLSISVGVPPTTTTSTTTQTPSTSTTSTTQTPSTTSTTTTQTPSTTTTTTLL